MAARLISKLLRRRGLIFPRSHWTRAHQEWITAQSWAHPADRLVVRDYQLALAQLESRLTELDHALEDLTLAPPYRGAAQALRCFRGIDTVTAIMLLAELYDIRRFAHPRALMAFVGLVPSEASTGDRQRRGGLTRTGNSLVRRLLIQAAWHYHHAPRLGPAVRRRREGQPAAVVAIAVKAEHRLSHRYRRLCARQKPKPLVIAAVARELIGFVWAMLQLPETRMA